MEIDSWNDKDVHIDIPYITHIKAREDKQKKKGIRKYAVNSQPMQPSSGDSMEGVITSILIAANIVCPRNNNFWVIRSQNKLKQLGLQNPKQNVERK